MNCVEIIVVLVWFALSILTCGLVMAVGGGWCAKYSEMVAILDELELEWSFG